MSECRHHGDMNNANTRRLTWALAVIVVFMIVEAIGGWISGSLALLADATHMLADAVALGLAASAQLLAARPPDSKLHFGYRRAQVLAAFVNGVLMAVLLVWIVVEAFTRLFNPIEVDAQLMFIVAVVGLLANLLAFTILHRNHEQDLNMRGALLHVVGDLLGSVAAIVAAGVIAFTSWTPIDPLLSIFVAILIGFSAYRLIRETGFILLEGAPANINMAELEEHLVNASPAITGVHKIQITQITPDLPRLTLHAYVDSAENAGAALAAIKDVLEGRYGVEHSTVQIEIGWECPDSSLGIGVAATAPAKSSAHARATSSDAPPADLSRSPAIN